MSRVLDFSLYSLRMINLNNAVLCYNLRNCRLSSWTGLQDITGRSLLDTGPANNISQIRTITKNVACLSRKLPSDPGLSKRANIFKDDHEFNRNLQDEEDFDELESDFENADLSNHDHKRLVRKKRHDMDKMMTIKKFFSGPKPPSMLTWAERLQIKELHEKDPEEWSIDVLAESFPATREVITKVLNADWVPGNAKKIERMDEIVRRNWKLLSEDKLEADPETLAHFKKFLSRREEYLAKIGTADFEKILRKEEPKKQWNNGQMTGILESYEKQLEMIDENATLRLQAEKVNLIGGDSEKLSERKDAKSDMDIVRERINFERDFNANDTDTFVIGGGEGRRDDRPITFDKLKEELHGKAQKDGISNPMEKVISENTNYTEAKSVKMHINNRLAILAGYTIPPYVGRPDNKPQRKPSKFIGGSDFKKTDKKRDILSQSFGHEQKNNVDSIQSKNDLFSQTEDNKTAFVDELKSSLPSNPDQSVTLDHKVSEDHSNQVKSSLNCSNEQEKQEFVNEESSIEGTFFWPNDDASEKSSVPSYSSVQTVTENNIDNSKEAIQNVAEFRKSLQTPKKREEEHTDYPDRITIPREKRGKGLTYRVNDCFYDEDGQFLYRVPGMTKTVA